MLKKSKLTCSSNPFPKSQPIFARTIVPRSSVLPSAPRPLLQSDPSSLYKSSKEILKVEIYGMVMEFQVQGYKIMIGWHGLKKGQILTFYIWF